MLKIYPKFDDDLLIKLFHKGVKSQWTIEDVDWDRPMQFSPTEAKALGRVLSPVYLGEQSAMIGASVAIPQVAMAGETSAQLYLTSFMMDEARHFEVLTHLYRRFEMDPVTLREMPEILRYHNRLRKGDRIDWVWGILISDIFAKNFYHIFARSQPEALFGKLSTRIVQDESRHQAFAEFYLKRAIPDLPPERFRVLVNMKDELLAIMDAMYQRLNDDANRIGLDGRKFLEDLQAEIERKAQRIGLDVDQPGNASGGLLRAAHAMGSTLLTKAGDLTSKFQALVPSQCDACFVSLLCRSRLVSAVSR